MIVYTRYMLTINVVTIICDHGTHMMFKVKIIIYTFDDFDVSTLEKILVKSTKRYNQNGAF